MKTLSIPSLPTPTIIQDYSCLAYWIKVAPIDRIIKNKLSGIARTFPISIFRVIPLLILIHIPAQIIPSRVWPKPSLLSSFHSSRPPQFAPLNRNEFLIFYQFPNQNQNHLGNYTNYAIMTSFQPLHSTSYCQYLSPTSPSLCCRHPSSSSVQCTTTVAATAQTSTRTICKQFHIWRYDFYAHNSQWDTFATSISLGPYLRHISLGRVLCSKINSRYCNCCM